MPRVYSEGRKCPTCGKALLRRQYKYCSLHCANARDRLKPGQASDRMPSDDELWNRRTEPWTTIARGCKINMSTFYSIMGRRHWKRAPRTHELVQAPCSTCGSPMAVKTRLTRVCGDCSAPVDPDRVRLERERTRRLPGGDRFPHLWMTSRPYTGDYYGGH